jgi:hypothetical protein
MPFRARITASAASAAAGFLSGTNDPASTRLVLKLVNRVRKLR